MFCEALVCGGDALSAFSKDLVSDFFFGNQGFWGIIIYFIILGQIWPLDCFTAFY